jgi:response regulator RpfG family c-di-GMP phosphodiesterase
LVENIPRLEMVCAILDTQECNFDGSGSPIGSPQGEAIPLGARVLKLVTDYDFLEAGGSSPSAAISTLQGRKGRYDPKLLNALARAKGKATSGAAQIKLDQLQVGMLLIQDVLSSTGTLLVPRGHEVTQAILTRLSSLPPGSVREPLAVTGS